jgi:hypothetical protein
MSSTVSLAGIRYFNKRLLYCSILVTLFCNISKIAKFAANLTCSGVCAVPNSVNTTSHGFSPGWLDDARVAVMIFY